MQADAARAGRAIKLFGAKGLSIKSQCFVYIRHNQARHDYSRRRFRSSYCHDLSFISNLQVQPDQWPNDARPDRSDGDTCRAMRPLGPAVRRSSDSGSRDGPCAPPPASPIAVQEDAERWRAAKWKMPQSAL